MPYLWFEPSMSEPKTRFGNRCNKINHADAGYFAIIIEDHLEKK